MGLPYGGVMLPSLGTLAIRGPPRASCHSRRKSRPSLATIGSEAVRPGSVIGVDDGSSGPRVNAKAATSAGNMALKAYAFRRVSRRQKRPFAASAYECGGGRGDLTHRDG